MRNAARLKPGGVLVHASEGHQQSRTPSRQTRPTHCSMTIIKRDRRTIELADHTQLTWCSGRWPCVDPDRLRDTYADQACAAEGGVGAPTFSSSWRRRSTRKQPVVGAGNRPSTVGNHWQLCGHATRRGQPKRQKHAVHREVDRMRRVAGVNYLVRPTTTPRQLRCCGGSVLVPRSQV